MEGYYEAALEASARSSAEVILFGANYDLMLTPPNVFDPHILPALSRWAERLHAAGKLLLTHTDGENQKLLRLYLEAGVDVADSVCPAPMTRLSLREYRDAFGGRIAIWGGLCSTCVLPGSFTDAQFEQHVTEALAAVGDGRGLIFSLADTTPPEASLDRIRRIGDRIVQHGD
jgi:hypothetical protein